MANLRDSIGKKKMEEYLAKKNKSKADGKATSTKKESK